MRQTFPLIGRKILPTGNAGTHAGITVKAELFNRLRPQVRTSSYGGSDTRVRMIGQIDDFPLLRKPHILGHIHDHLNIGIMSKTTKVFVTDQRTLGSFDPIAGTITIRHPHDLLDGARLNNAVNINTIHQLKHLSVISENIHLSPGGPILLDGQTHT